MAASSVLRLGGDPLPGLGYLPLSACNIPVTDGLVGAHFFNMGADMAIKNFAGGDDAVFVGAPIEHEGYMGLSGPGYGAGYLQTNILETAAGNQLLIARRPGDLSCGMFGTYAGNTDAGIGVYGQTEDYWKYVVGKQPDTAEQMTISGDINSWAILETSQPATGFQSIRNHTTGSSNTAIYNTNRDVSGRTYRIGRLYGSGFIGPVDIACALFFDRQWLDEERAAMVLWARQFAADNDIPA
ncbi:hypothetical protein [Sphingobium yanoikuyae]|uniref:hypothetical protein n=1 Tax=Sphingobium yanoikuyae TaxID=13690 RepID=UPI0028AA4484|nr:hypothetical protein [Sphingobium yanoikuyae]